MRAFPVVVLLSLATATLAQPRVVVDAGHGGSQEGAVGACGLMEKELALQLGARLKGALERTAGAKVSLTRERDALMSLSERVAFANRQRPDLFISLHANSMPTRKLRERTHGIVTFFLSADATDEEALHTAHRENAEGGGARPRAKQSDTLAFILADLQRTEAHAESSKAAYQVHRRMISATGAQDRGVQQAPFYVLTGVDAPAILLEVGFISHPDECRRLQDGRYQERLTQAIADGAKAFLDELSRRDARASRAATP